LMLDGNRTIFFSTHITTDLDRIADYIAFIQGGKLVFNQSIHEVAENYALVKGSVELLDRDTEKAFIHIHPAPTGFEALTNNIAEVEETFGNTVIIERASLEDVMYYLEGGVQHVQLNKTRPHHTETALIDYHPIYSSIHTYNFASQLDFPSSKHLYHV